MARAKKINGTSPDSAANGSLEAMLWAAADALRINMDAAEYKHVVLGLIFLKYISDAFEVEGARCTIKQSDAVPCSTNPRKSPARDSMPSARNESCLTDNQAAFFRAARCFRPQDLPILPLPGPVAGDAYRMCSPPSTKSVVPVMKDASCEANQRIG